MRRVFFSFDWDDVWRVNQVRYSRNRIAKGRFVATGFVDAADIEKVKRKTDYAIKKWIDEQLHGTSVTCVLIGSKTSNSKWVKYEIEKSIEKGNGLLGVLIHDLKDRSGNTSKEGANPLENYNENNWGDKVKEALKHGGVGWGLAKIVFPQLAIPAVVITAGYSLLKDDDYQIYDWHEDEGHENLGYWIEEAARQVGR